MSAPTFTIKSQTRRARIVVVSGSFTGTPPESGTLSLTPAATPNGAVAKSGAIVFNFFNNTWSCTLAAVVYGNYAPPVATLTNPDGSTSALGWAFTLFAPNTLAPGVEPTVFLPPFAAPTFNAPTVALGTEVTTVTLQNTAGTAVTAPPFTFGQPFHVGHLAPTDFLVGKVAGGADIPLQFNVKATHPDGSVRHATISGIGPNLAAGEMKTISMVRSATGASTAPLASPAFTAQGFSSWVNVYFGTTLFSAAVNERLSAGIATSSAWIGGEIATEYSVMMPFKDDTGAQHPDLTVQFNVRYYPAKNAAKIDVTLEHTKAYSAISDLVYSGAIRVGGISRFNILKPGTVEPLVHFPTARWKKTLWFNNDNPVHVRHNIDYLIDSRAIPNYDRRVVISEEILAEYAAALPGPKFGPMGEARFQRAMGTTGGRPDLGLAPDSYAAAVLSMDPRAIAMMLASADAGGSWSIHRRDTSVGPRNGKPIDLQYWPYTTILGGASDAKNPATGVSEKFPGAVDSTTPFMPDSSHQPAFAYIPYLLTGDFYYLEELHFWNNYNSCKENPGYRLYELGLTTREQLRGQGWCMRTLAQSAYITPDTHHSKQFFRYLLDNNLDYYNRTYTDSPDSNKLGIIINGPSFNYDVIEPNTGIPPWMDDFFTQSIGLVAELGFPEALRLLRWKAKFQVGRMIAPGVCFVDACMYAIAARDTETSPIYTTLAQCMQRTISAERYAMPCNSPERLAQYILETGNDRTVLSEITGYASSTEGYPSNFQPALAYAAESGGYPDGDLAWDLFDTRSVKPNYGRSPQFAIVPRSFTAFEAPPPPPPPPPPPDDPGELQARYSRPIADLIPGGWVPSSGLALAAMIDEPAPGDSDFITASAPGTTEIALQPLNNPGLYNGQAVRYQAWDAASGGLTINLKQGGTLIAQWHHASLPTAPTEFVRYLLPEETARITDYTDLRCSFVAI